MDIIKTDIDGVLIIEPKIFGDNRGFFMETYKKSEFYANGIEIEFNQDNHSKSTAHVLRGLHFQKGKHVQSKLVKVVSGNVLDVAVDIRKGSPTFGKYVMVNLTGENHRQLFIPRGFAHGFIVLSEHATFQYKCDNFYHPESEGAIIWNDPDINIDWSGVDIKDIILSEKDKCHPTLKESDYLFDYNTDYYKL